MHLLPSAALLSVCDRATHEGEPLPSFLLRWLILRSCCKAARSEGRVLLTKQPMLQHTCWRGRLPTAQSAVGAHPARPTADDVSLGGTPGPLIF